MRSSRRAFLTGLASGAASLTCTPAKREGVTRLVRYRHQRKISFGILDGETIHQIEGNLFGSRAETGTTLPLGEARLLYPVPPRKVLALAGNYQSHLGDQPAPKNPEPFFKANTALLSPGANIVFPPGAQDVHFEAELVSGGENRLRASNGVVNVRLLGEPSLKLDASTSNGSVKCQRPITTQGISGKNRLEGTIGNGNASLVVKTSNSSLTVD